MVICEKSKCTACGACRDACPKGCISFCKDEYGAEFITIDEVKCIKCGKCKRVCQTVEPLTLAQPKKTYVACLKDLEIRNRSASGGAAYAFYSKILEEGGVAYGATFDNDFKLIFEKTDKKEELTRFQGSKYTFSDMEGTYKDIEEELKGGRNVIFIGTSCQCAGIKKYIPEKLQDKLYLCDIICHGMPPAAYFNEYIKSLKDKFENLIDVSFRNNNIYRFKALSENGTAVEEKAAVNPFLANYTRQVFYRENCYSCRYATDKRVSDLTIGDYWGSDRARMLKPTDKGMSVILGNTEKGIKLIERCNDRLVLTLKQYEHIIRVNEQLRGPSKKPYYRELFLYNYKNSGFNRAAAIIVKNIARDEFPKKKAPIYRRIKWKLKKEYNYLTDFHHRGRFIRDHVRNPIDRARLKNKDFTILANNCIGGVISHDLGLKFMSPTVNLFIRPDDFVKFLENFDYYKGLEIKEIPYYTDYPVGMLGDIPLFFKHYDTFDEAVSKWKERMERINYDNLFVMMTDRFCCSYSSLEKFEKLPFKNKVCFTAGNYPEFPHCVQVKKKSTKASVYIITNIMNYFGKRLYEYGDGFDYIHFLNTGAVKKR